MQVDVLRGIILEAHAAAFAKHLQAKGYSQATIQACEEKLPELYAALQRKPATAEQKIREVKDKLFPGGLPHEVAERERAAAAAAAAAHVRGALEADAFGIPPASGPEPDFHKALVEAYVADFMQGKVEWTNVFKTKGRLAQGVQRMEAELAVERVLHWQQEHPDLLKDWDCYHQRLRDVLAAAPAEPLAAAATGGAEGAGAGAAIIPSRGEGDGAGAATTAAASGAPAV